MAYIPEGGIGYSTRGKAGWPRRSRPIQVADRKDIRTCKGLGDGARTITYEQVPWQAEEASGTLGS